jgi:DNA-directed RNA polymerase subunit M/transcription elongation factor TFIIS
MKEKLQNFFMGRNGADSLSRFTLTVSMVFIVVSLCTRNILNGVLSNVFWTLALITIIYSYWRTLSRNVYKRSAENDRYIAATSGIRTFFRNEDTKFKQRKSFKFFKCPSCKTMLRVPRGKGKIQITCKKCGNRFTGKT